jgi:hypothetical protein
MNNKVEQKAARVLTHRQLRAVVSDRLRNAKTPAGAFSRILELYLTMLPGRKPPVAAVNAETEALAAAFEADARQS